MLKIECHLKSKFEESRHDQEFRFQDVKSEIPLFYRKRPNRQLNMNQQGLQEKSGM